MNDRTPRHGGDTAAATARFGMPAGGWVDLSTGVNPWPWPVPHHAVDELARFPASSDLARLEAAARTAYRVPDACDIVAASGSELLIRQIPRLMAPGKVAVAVPTYRSHGEAWREAGHEVVPWAPGEPPPAAVAVVCNPNNPDGVSVPPGTLAGAAAASSLLVVDEAFADLEPALSLVPALDGLQAVVLRSFGKFYGLPGLRLGFAIGQPALMARLGRAIGDWPVSSLAAAVGAAALSDRAWQAATRARLAEESERLRLLLGRAGLTPVGGTDLFQLVAADDASALHTRLARRGVLTRLFAAEERLRIGIPPDDAAWARLSSALAEATS